MTQGRDNNDILTWALVILCALSAVATLLEAL